MKIRGMRAGDECRSIGGSSVLFDSRIGWKALRIPGDGLVEVSSLALDFVVPQKSVIHKFPVDGEDQDTALKTGLPLNQKSHRIVCHYYNKTVSCILNLHRFRLMKEDRNVGIIPCNNDLGGSYLMIELTEIIRQYM